MLGAIERASFVAIASLVLPLVGYSFFIILTLGVAGIGLLMGVRTLILAIYASGLAPTAATALFYEIALHRRPLWVSIPLTGCVGLVSAWAWWRVALDIDLFEPKYAHFAINASGALAVMLIPVVRGAWERQRGSITTAKIP